MEYPPQAFMPSSTYAMDQTFSAPYNPMLPLADAPSQQGLQYHYDAIAQGVKPFHYQTPAGSPHSTSHSFHDQPPILSASSESGASVSSSAMGSPLHAAQFNDSWNPMGLGLTSSFEYPAMVAAEKTFVGESKIFSSVSSFSSKASPSQTVGDSHVFKTPTTPASAPSRSIERSTSLLSNTYHQRDVSQPASILTSQCSSSRISQSISTCWLPLYVEQLHSR